MQIICESGEWLSLRFQVVFKASANITALVLGRKPGVGQENVSYAHTSEITCYSLASHGLKDLPRNFPFTLSKMPLGGLVEVAMLIVGGAHSPQHEVNQYQPPLAFDSQWPLPPWTIPQQISCGQSSSVPQVASDLLLGSPQPYTCKLSLFL